MAASRPTGCGSFFRRELSGGRQRFWAYISFGLPHSPLPDYRRTSFPEIMVVAVAAAAVVVAAVVVWAWEAAPP